MYSPSSSPTLLPLPQVDPSNPLYVLSPFQILVLVLGFTLGTEVVVLFVCLFCYRKVSKQPEYDKRRSSNKSDNIL